MLQYIKEFFMMYFLLKMVLFDASPFFRQRLNSPLKAPVKLIICINNLDQFKLMKISVTVKYGRVTL